MKRYFYLFALFFLISTICAVVVFHNLYASQNNVVLTRNVLIGDASAADGLVAVTKANLNYHLFWETTNDIGTEHVTTDSRYTVTRDHSGNRGVSAPRFEVTSELPLGIDFTSVLEKINLTLGEIEAQNFDVTLPDGTSFREAATDPALGICAAYNALYMDAPIGEEVSATVRVADYFDFYPITLNVSIPGVYWTNNDYDENAAARGTEHYVTKRFREFFRFPVLENEELEIHLTRRNGSGMSWGSSHIGDNMFSLWSLSAISDHHIYFTIDGGGLDTSEIPGGYGIYRVSYEAGEGYHTENIGMTGDDLATVYPLDPNTEIRDLYINESKTHLLLVTAAADTATVDIIACETMEKTQSFNIPVPVDGYYSHMRVFGDYTVIVTNETLTVLSEDDGVYTEQFRAAIYEGEGDDREYDLRSNAAMDFDGERLAIAYPMKSDYRVNLCGYWVAVYEKTGCTFFAEYESSLDAGKNGTWSSDFDTHGRTEVRWE